MKRRKFKYYDIKKSLKFAMLFNFILSSRECGKNYAINNYCKSLDKPVQCIGKDKKYGKKN